VTPCRFVPKLHEELADFWELFILKKVYVLTKLNVVASQKSVILILIAVRTSGINERLFKFPNCDLYTDIILLWLYSPLLGLGPFSNS
jgi:hypothetical protein